MAQTPLTGSSAYATNADFLERYDARTVGDLLSDQGKRLQPSSISGSTRLTALLQQVSGEIEVAAVAGKRYQPEDLTALTGNAQQFLVGMVCDLALWRLLNRRPMIQQMPLQCQQAFQLLELLRGGERIFPTDEAADAGVNIERVSETDCLLTEKAKRYFGCSCSDC